MRASSFLSGGRNRKAQPMQVWCNTVREEGATTDEMLPLFLMWIVPGIVPRPVRNAGVLADTSRHMKNRKNIDSQRSTSLYRHQ
jgi:hypothetical protein